MRPFFHFTLKLKCPACGAGTDHWCRDAKGKCIPPHRERSRAAVAAMLAPFGVAKEKKRA